MQIKNARFIKSILDKEDAPSFTSVEFVFMGRSNVGKSSLINALCHKKSLARTSKTPGKTRLINFFHIHFQDENNNIFPSHLIDIPGTGYAKVSKQEQKQWQEKLEEFLHYRKHIRVFVHLIDSRHLNLASDNLIRSFLESFKDPSQIIFSVYTKIDKIKQGQRQQLLKQHPQAALVSVNDTKSIENLTKRLFVTAFKIP